MAFIRNGCKLHMCSFILIADAERLYYKKKLHPYSSI